MRLIESSTFFQYSRLATKGEIRILGQTGKLAHSYPILTKGKDYFDIEPSNVFSLTSQYLVQSRLLNSFTIYSIVSMSKLLSISYHKVRLKVIIGCG